MTRTKGFPLIKVSELLPEEYHDQVSPESLEIEVPLDSFPKVNVEVLSKIHIFNPEKSEELIFDPYPEEDVILQHKTYMKGPGTYSWGFTDYYKNGSAGHGQFIIE